MASMVAETYGLKTIFFLAYLIWKNFHMIYSRKICIDCKILGKISPLHDKMIFLSTQTNPMLDLK